MGSAWTVRGRTHGEAAAEGALPARNQARAEAAAKQAEAEPGHEGVGGDARDVIESARYEREPPESAQKCRRGGAGGGGG
eukprot:1128594-Prorocentrum_minimum.AAC.1